MPLLKKGKKLTNEEAETLVTFISNINKKALEKFSKSQPVSVDDVKEAFKRIPKKRGGPVNIDLKMPRAFAMGGLSGGDKSGPPPERGPNPQGLLSLMKRARNY